MNSWIVPEQIPHRASRAFLLTVLATTVLLMVARTLSASAAETVPMGPMASAQSVVDQAKSVFKEQNLAPAEREKKLRAIAEGHFDFEKMARTAVGRHWRDFSPAQQAEFVPLFTNFIEDIYLSRMEQYSVEKIQRDVQSSNIQFLRERMDERDQAVVFSAVTLQDRPKPVNVNYLMKLDGNEWRIYDITIDAISVIANYRNQFNRVLNDGGYDKLAGILRQKQQKLDASMTTPTQ